MTVKRHKQKAHSDNSNPKVPGMTSRSKEASCLLRTHAGCQSELSHLLYQYKIVII